MEISFLKILYGIILFSYFLLNISVSDGGVFLFVIYHEDSFNFLHNTY